MNRPHPGILLTFLYVIPDSEQLKDPGGDRRGEPKASCSYNSEPMDAEALRW